MSSVVFVRNLCIDHTVVHQDTDKLLKTKYGVIFKCGWPYVNLLVVKTFSKLPISFFVIFLNNDNNNSSYLVFTFHLFFISLKLSNKMLHLYVNYIFIIANIN